MNGLTTLKTDLLKLHIIFSNLISNAIKFTIEGKIEYGISTSKTEYLFWVKDTGIGIESKYYNRIFETFFQIDGSMSRKFEGAGIGLALSKGLVELLGGKIWVESQVGKGSTFWFSLPS